MNRKGERKKPNFVQDGINSTVEGLEGSVCRERSRCTGKILSVWITVCYNTVAPMVLSVVTVKRILSL